MKKLNNVDRALTPQPEPDQWTEQDEQTEDTGKPSKLILGPRADALFSAAHAAGEALRRVRRGATQVVPDPPPRKWTITEEFDYDATVQKIDNREPYDYYDFLEVMKRVTSGKRKRQQVAPEWRELPNYPGYLLHSVTRELWRSAREVPLPNGNIRRYPAKVVQAFNGSFSLSVGGVRSSRGVQSLWAETFPDYAGRKTKAAQIRPRRDEFDYYHGLREWLAEGGAGIVTRPN
ncbi:hypothetical protein [Mycolicibacterium rhodesiae]|uniref:Uncharacterized protein n=1 Tax=Mycolicibacterium rhodesiae TaxID=36814 RepID=A0A1X0J6J1_MYCRH|nr:hypothetical protein [Mycolicibacterium rhodesiae]MCV7348277.1 hypothetical protein [Mycolicibacterium rhodesiae]ORB57385.1 hypothetical protein BST42_03140 [Mycolicibacterium rhodesiae]